MHEFSHAVVIAGGGPTGMMLAAELALAGVDVAIVERRENQDIAGSRAGGMHTRTLEVLDQRGIVDRFLAEGQKHQVASFASVHLDISDFPTRHPYGLALWQVHIERILAGWVNELPVTFYRKREVTGFTQDHSGVAVVLSDGQTLRATFLIGCDGGRSLVRKTAGIEFPGWDPTISNLIAEVEMHETPPLGMQKTSHGIHGFGRLQYDIVDGKVVFRDEGPIRVMVPEPTVGATTDPTLDDLRAALIAIYGTDYGVHTSLSLSRFTDTTRQAATYRDRRIFLAGDAAHVHSPVGGFGLGTGVQDAVNLGWKLALVIKRQAPDSLLDTYHAERHPVAAKILRHTMGQMALLRTDERTTALNESLAGIMKLDEVRRTLGAEMSGLAIRYDLGEGHPLLGRRMPDLDLTTADGVRHVYSFLHQARAALINFGEPGALDISPWADRVPLVDATYDGVWELPGLGVVSAPTAVLVRPDGYVAWVGEGTDSGLVEALVRWFGPATS